MSRKLTIVSYHGEKIAIVDLAKRLGIRAKTIYAYIARHGNLKGFDNRFENGHVGGSITYKGRTMGCDKWAKELGLTKGQVWSRWKNHGTLEKPPRKQKFKAIEWNGEKHTFPEWAKILNVNPLTLKERWYRHGTLGEIPRKQKIYEYRGEKHTLKEWAKILNVNPDALRIRYSKNKSFEAQPYQKKKIIEFRNEKHTYSEWAEILGIPEITVRRRWTKTGSLEEPIKEKKAAAPRRPRKRGKHVLPNSPPPNRHSNTYLSFLADIAKIRVEEEAEDLKPLREVI